MTSRVSFYLLPLVVCLITGCDSADSNTGIVQGTITIDGQLPAKGSMSFSPLDGSSPTAGCNIVEGRYEAIVPLGTAKVEIRVPKQVGERKIRNTPDSPVRPVIEEVLPPKYNDQTELEVDVVPGETECNFDLSSK